jgi:hypothetical protein
MANKLEILKHNYIKNPLVNNDGSITPRPCTVTDLAMIYGVNRRTINTWLKPFEAEIGKRSAYYFTQKQIQIIFEKLGEPMPVDFENLKVAA